MPNTTAVLPLAVSPALNSLLTAALKMFNSDLICQWHLTPADHMTGHKCYGQKAYLIYVSRSMILDWLPGLTRS